jgi:GNAT superfamily N-acetyltransferase
MIEEQNPIVRPLRASDVPAAFSLSLEAGWNQTHEDWSMLIQLSPNGCLGIDVNGVLVSTGTLFCYGRRLAWVGMVLTKIAFRGRGFARRILTHALNLADELGVETVKLDATDQGRPLYEKLGFCVEQPVERWLRPGDSGVPLIPFGEDQSPGTGWHSMDSRAFGTNRTQLLEALALRRTPILEGTSYALSRPGRENNFLGPCVADSPKTAKTLIERSLLAAERGGWVWDLFPKNSSANGLATDLGFAPHRHLTRMVRGKEMRGQEDLVFALAGFELG